AKNEDRLRAYVKSMLSFLEKGEAELIDFAYTLQVGRDEMPERLTLIVSDTEELKRKFVEVLHGGDLPKNTWRKNIRSKEAKAAAVQEEETFLQMLAEQRQLPKLAELWVSGAKVNWRLLYKADLPRRISVPTYPFARERY